MTPASPIAERVAAFDRPTISVVALEGQTNPLGRHGMLAERLVDVVEGVRPTEPVHRGSRSGGVRRSLADIPKARSRLDWASTHRIRAGLDTTADWHAADR